MPLFFVDNVWELTSEELAAAQVRVRRHRLAVGLTLALVATGIFGARPAVHAVKNWQSRRLSEQALTFIDRQQWAQARDRAADACALQPAEPMALRAYGRLLARTGNSGALSYYRRLQELAALTPEDRRDFARVALMEGEVSTASAQSAWLLAHEWVSNGKSPPRALPADRLLAAQAASASGDEPAALAFVRPVLDDPAASESERFTAAVRVVNAAASIDPDGPAAAPAWACVRHLADSPGLVGLNALTLLSRRRVLAPGDARPPGWMARGDIARALENHPLAHTPQKLLAADLAADADGRARATVVGAAVAQWRDADDASLAALAEWLLHGGEAAPLLEVLPAARCEHNAVLYLRRLDALAALNRWDEMNKSLKADNALDPVSQHLYLAATAGRLQDQRDATMEWNQALELSGRDPGKLFAVGQYAEEQEASDIAESAYAATIIVAPRMRSAHEAFYRLATARGQTAKARTALAAMLEIWPQDEAVIHREAYLRLLLGVSATDASRIEKDAAAFAAREPGNWQARATLALARLRQGQGAGALLAFSGLHAAGGGLVPPNALAVRAAALAAAGWKDEARADARALAGTVLRPEERALLAPLDVE